MEGELGNPHLGESSGSVSTAGSNDLSGVEALTANVVGRVVEEGGELAEGLGLEVKLLVFLLGLVVLLLEPVETLLNGPLELVETLLVVVVEGVETGREVGSSEEAETAKENAGEDALE